MVSILVNDSDSKMVDSIDSRSIEKMTESLLSGEDVDTNIEIGISFLSEESMKEINLKSRNIGEATDVISLPLFESKDDINYFSRTNDLILLGDIFICPEKIRKDAKEDGLRFNEYFREIYCHGLLHLLGYKHDNDAKYKKMIALQKTYAKSS